MEGKSVITTPGRLEYLRDWLDIVGCLGPTTMVYQLVDTIGNTISSYFHEDRFNQNFTSSIRLRAVA